MQRQPERGAGLGQASARLAVHVHLPVERRQRHEVVFSLLDRDPGQAVAARTEPARARAQGLLPIVDRDLRDGAEQEAPQLRQPEQRRDEQRERAGCARTGRCSHAW